MVACTLTYGLGRKLLHVHNAKEKNYKTNKHEDMFLTSKAAVVLLGGFANTIYWPMNVARDLYRFEAYVRKVPLDKPENFIEYLMY